MNVKSVLLLLFFLSRQVESLACTCVWAGPFLDISLDTTYSDLVAVVTVKEHLDFSGRNKKTPKSMEVEVVEVLRGQEDRKTIKIWGDNGMMCRSYISEFPEGTTWVLVLRQGSEGWGHREELTSDYAIPTSGCGGYSLRKKGRKVVGYIEKKEKYYHDKNGNYVEYKPEKISFRQLVKKFEESRLFHKN